MRRSSMAPTWRNTLGLLLALSSTALAASDSRSPTADPWLPLAFTQYYCYCPGSACDASGCPAVGVYVQTPDAWTTGPADWSPTGSPDATQVAFNRGGDIMVMNLASGAVANITNTAGPEWYPAWSPNGSHIAFLSNRDGPIELYVMDQDGSDVARVTVNVGVRVDRPTWSPDSTRLAFTCQVSGNDDVCAINADGTAFAQLTTDPAADSNPAWSPDGGLIAFATDRYTYGSTLLAVMSPDGSAVSLVGNGIYGWQPAWSPDGLQLAFVGQIDFEFSLFGFGIYIMRADGSDINLVAYEASDPAWMGGPFVPAPFARFVATCDYLTCTFDATASTGDITSYAWNFGDQASATGSVVSHTYATGGQVVVELTVTNADGRTSTRTEYISVRAPNQPPTASFTFNCFDSFLCQFTGSAQDPDGSISVIRWTFGDGGVFDCCLNVSHLYAAAGTYTITLQVTDNEGASTMVSQSVTLSTFVMHVGDLDGTASPSNGPWTATVAIEIHRPDHTPIGGAVVAVLWSTGVAEFCQTNAAGRCSLRRPGINPAKAVSLTVTGVTHSVHSYSPAGNHDPDGDSSGTTITISKR